MRLFIAIPLPAEVVAALADLQKQLRISMPEADQVIRWTEPRQIHLTLRFFGNVEEEKLAALRARIVLATADFRPFELRLGQCGGFPHSNPSRRLCAGPDGGLTALHALDLTLQIDSAD